MIDDITVLIYEAQNDSRKLNKLIEDYLPFIKSCVARSKISKQSRDDALTLAMLTFADCVKAYRAEKGSFVSFAQTSIRNRLIDDFRSERKFFSKIIPNHDNGIDNSEYETKLSVNEYRLREEKISLRNEIEELSAILAAWNTSFAELSKLCPKQKRTRAQCEYIAALLLKNEEWRSALLTKRRMPGKELRAEYGVSVKILEKYRKYIATICIIQSGDYPMLQAFLPSTGKGGIEIE